MPICAIPKGSFFLVDFSTFLKLINIPCAVSGLKNISFFLSSTTPQNVLNIKLKFLISVKSFAPHLGQHIFCSLNISNISFELLPKIKLSSSTNLSALNLDLQFLQSVKGSEKPSKCPEAFHTSLFIKIAESKPTLYSHS